MEELIEKYKADIVNNKVTLNTFKYQEAPIIWQKYSMRIFVLEKQIETLETILKEIKK